MSLQIDSTELICTFCKRDGLRNFLVRGMHGLYCTNAGCYSRLASGNLAPPATCSKCGENAFYEEANGTIETGMYVCIACDFRDPI